MTTATNSLKKRSSRRNPLTLPRRGDYTFRDFCQLVADGQKGDLINGVIYVAPPDNIQNADLQMWLAGYLYEFVGIYRLGKVFTSRVAYRIDDENSPEPDIGFVSKDWADTIKTGRVDGPPTLAVELVSPDSVHRDYVAKRALYERAGVLEYWIIDAAAQDATFLIRRNDRFVKGRLQNSVWQSKVLTGFVLDTKWLRSKNRPRIFDLLRDHYYPQN